MKQKIIGLVSCLALFGGFVAAGILSAGEPTLLQCMALGAVALIGGAGAFYTYLYMVMNEKEESVSPHIEIETETFKKVAGDFKVHMDARSASDV